MAPPPTVLLLAATLAVVILSATAGARKPATALPFSGGDGSRAGRMMRDESNDPNGVDDEVELAEKLGKFTVDTVDEVIRRQQAFGMIKKDKSKILVYEEVVTADIGQQDQNGRRRCVLLVKAMWKKGGDTLIRAHMIADSSNYTMTRWNYEARPHE